MGNCLAKGGNGGASGGAGTDGASSSGGGVLGGKDGKISKDLKDGAFSNENFIFSNNNKPITEKYQLDNKKLGEGTYGSVSKALDIKLRCVRAVKLISKRSEEVRKNLPRFKQEIAIMKFVDHPNVVKLYETFEDRQFIYLVMELCQGGELFDRIVQATHFNETQAATVLQQMLKPIFYLHENGIMHRDLKPENFLFVEKDAAIEKSTLKIIDFGLSCKFKKGEAMKTKAGTPYYVSPQVLQGRYDESCDVWSCGVMMYIMLCGYPPFYGEQDHEVLQKVRQAHLEFNKQDWKNISDDAIQLIQGMLVKDPARRLTAAQALEHVWIKKKAPKAKEVNLNATIVGNLNNFRVGNKLKRAALHIIAAHLDEGAIKNLRALFMQLDKNGDGQLTIQEMKEGLQKAKLDKEYPELEQMMKDIDSDQSGQIDYTEFLAASLDRKHYENERLCWAAFKVFDRNNDGVISKQELAEVLNNGDLASQVGKELIEKIMADADTNGDGEIDFNEFMAMMKKDSEGIADIAAAKPTKVLKVD